MRPSANQHRGDAGHGDSGGPWFLAKIRTTPRPPGQIAAIVSFGYGVAPADIDNDPTDSSFGEFNVETRISSFAGWIDSITSVKPVEFLVNADDAAALNDAATAIAMTPPLIIVASTTRREINRTPRWPWTRRRFRHHLDQLRPGHVGNGYGAAINGQNGVFARRYSANVDATASDVFQVNQTAQGNQQNAKVRWTPPAISPSPGKATRAATPALTTSTPAATPAPAWCNTPWLPTPDHLSGRTVYARPLIRLARSTNTDLVQYGANVLTDNGRSAESAGQFHQRPATSDSPAWLWTPPATPWLSGAATGPERSSKIRRASSTSASLSPRDTAGPTVGEVWNAVGCQRQHRAIGPRRRIHGARHHAHLFRRHLRRSPLDQGGAGGANSILNLTNWQLTSTARRSPAESPACPVHRPGLVAQRQV